ncbi:MAG: hypothetical protein K9I85_15495 [Saprospiraceae bacterium]|nr:hypothetical protein [Saprospiraceae bacterium]
MNTSGLKIALLALVTVAFITSCSNSSEKVANAEQEVTEANKALDEANEAYLQDIENFRSETAARIEANQRSIEDFNERISKEKKEVKADYQQKIAELEAKNSDMKTKLDGYKAEGKENWESFKVEFSRDMDELGTAFGNFFNK